MKSVRWVQIYKARKIMHKYVVNRDEYVKCKFKYSSSYQWGWKAIF